MTYTSFPQSQTLTSKSGNTLRMDHKEKSYEEYLRYAIPEAEDLQ